MLCLLCCKEIQRDHPNALNSMPLEKTFPLTQVLSKRPDTWTSVRFSFGLVGLLIRWNYWFCLCLLFCKIQWKSNFSFHRLSWTRVDTDWRGCKALCIPVWINSLCTDGSLSTFVGMHWHRCTTPCMSVCINTLCTYGAVEHTWDCALKWMQSPMCM